MNVYLRQQVIERFKLAKPPFIFLISLRAGGVGLNLGEASHIVVFDRWWNPAIENQAIYRAHRFDRQEPLHVVRFLIRDSIEERIASILDEKAKLFDYVVENATQSGKGFTREEFARILELTGSNQPLKYNNRYER